jgi:DNA-binding CsgD family transcriptional regulator
VNNRERIFLILILWGIVVLVAFDLLIDSSEGVRWWHILVEGFLASAAGAGIFLIVRNTFLLKRSLKQQIKNSDQWRGVAQKWRKRSKKYLKGLSLEIDRQLELWALTAAEKQVAFLLLKGLSLKEIAKIRTTSEMTVRTQTIAIYSKAGIAGRSELAAFFLEDLFIPAEKEKA